MRERHHDTVPLDAPIDLAPTAPSGAPGGDAEVTVALEHAPEGSWYAVGVTTIDGHELPAQTASYADGELRVSFVNAAPFPVRLVGVAIDVEE